MKKLKKKHWILGYLFLHLWGCLQAQTSYDTLEEKLWNTNKDFTINVLSEIYQIINQYDKEKAKTTWLSVIQKAKKRNDTSLVIQISMEADRYFFAQKMLQEELLIAKDLTEFMQSKNLGTKEGEVYLLFAYRYLNTYMSDTALEYYLKALTIFEKHQDLPNLYKAYYGMGNAFFKADPKKSREYMLKSLQYKKYADNPRDYISSINTIGLTFRSEKDIPNTLKYFELALATALEYNDREWQGIIYGNIGGIHYNNKNYQTALNYFLKELTLVNDERDVIFTHLSIAECYALSNQTNQAKAHLDSGLAPKNIEDIYILRNRSRALKTYAAQINDYKNAYQYAEQYINYNDSVNKNRQAVQIKEITAKNEWEKQNILVMGLEEKTKLQNESIFRLRWIIYTIFVSIIILSVLLYVVNKYYRKTKKLNNILYQQQEEITAQNEELKQQKENLSFLNNRLEQEIIIKQGFIESKNRELLNYALKMADTNNFLEEIKSNITNNQGNSQQNKSLLYKIESNQNKEKDWDTFKRMFEEVNPVFFQQLSQNYTTLTVQELKLCALIKLNLSSKEISAILRINPASIYTARYRMRKKMNIDSEESLNDMLFKL